MNGVLVVALSTLGFSAGTVLIKALGCEVPATWVAFLRNLAPLPLLALAMRRRGVAFSSPHWRGLLLRGIWGAIAIGALCWALPRMPLANAVLMANASPLYAALWGVLFLDERLKPPAVLCLLAAFAGVCAALRPGLAVDALPFLAALAAGLFSSMAHVAVKTLTRSEPPLRIVFYAAVAGALFFLPAVARDAFRPSPGQWLMMLLVGGAVTLGQLLMTDGIARAPVSRASAGLLMTVVVNILAGWWLWGEAPDAWSWLGCLLIVGGIFGLSRDFRAIVR